MDLDSRLIRGYLQQQRRAFFKDELKSTKQMQMSRFFRHPTNLFTISKLQNPLHDVYYLSFVDRLILGL